MRPGIHTDISIGDYHGNKEWISATALKHAKRSMAELRYYLDGGFDGERKAHFDFGNAFELALLDPHGFNDQVAIMPVQSWIDQALLQKPTLKNPKLSSAYQELQADWQGQNVDRYWINETGPESFETITKMLESCYRDQWIQMLIKNIRYQATLCWIDPETQIQLKTRPDICTISKNIVVNLKTDTDAEPGTFNRKLANLDYPLQAAMEITGVEATGLMPQVDKYFWLVVEKQAPYNAQLYEFDRSDIEAAKDELKYILSRIKLASENNFWPGYGDRADNPYGILTARIPSYYGIYQQM